MKKIIISVLTIVVILLAINIILPRTFYFWRENSYWLFKYVESNDIDKVQLMLEKGADPNYIFEDNYTPFTYASKNENGEEILSKLLEFTNKVDKPDGKGYTPLGLAVEKERNKNVSILLKNGANPDLIYRSGYTPLTYASKIYSISLLKLLLKYTKEINHCDYNSNNALMVAIKNKNLDNVKILLVNGANPNSTCGEYGKYPIELAIELKCENDEDFNISKELISHGINYKSKNKALKLLKKRFDQIDKFIPYYWINLFNAEQSNNSIDIMETLLLNYTYPLLKRCQYVSFFGLQCGEVRSPKKYGISLSYNYNLGVGSIRRDFTEGSKEGSDYYTYESGSLITLTYSSLWNAVKIDRGNTLVITLAKEKIHGSYYNRGSNWDINLIIPLKDKNEIKKLRNLLFSYSSWSLYNKIEKEISSNK